MLRYLPFLLVIALTIYAFIDCLNTPEEEVKHLPKVVWVIIILLFSIVGPVVWLFAGKKRVAPEGGGRGPDGFGGFGGGGRARWVAPDDNPEFLDSLREQQRNRKPDGSDAASDADADEGKGGSAGNTEKGRDEDR
ncbi:PLD nuclease N-terminal domain-containing protein [Streptomyces sp. NPDC097619]|uniref:PLD nuclease N-terminal domain-containing protein n=1 Tax=Streptomyces sp. NPDC097619 TaxID=3157228 RepID=UPI003326424A